MTKTLERFQKRWQAAVGLAANALERPMGGSDIDAQGNVVDGREKFMARWFWLLLPTISATLELIRHLNGWKRTYIRHTKRK